jgi:hypothetical protein
LAETEAVTDKFSDQNPLHPIKSRNNPHASTRTVPPLDGANTSKTLFTMSNNKAWKQQTLNTASPLCSRSRFRLQTVKTVLLCDDVFRLPGAAASRLLQRGLRSFIGRLCLIGSWWSRHPIIYRSALGGAAIRSFIGRLLVEPPSDHLSVGSWWSRPGSNR